MIDDPHLEPGVAAAHVVVDRDDVAPEVGEVGMGSHPDLQRSQPGARELNRALDERRDADRTTRRGEPIVGAREPLQAGDHWPLDDVAIEEDAEPLRLPEETSERGVRARPAGLSR